MSNISLSTNKTNENFIGQSFDFENNPGLVFVTIACGCTSLWLFFIIFYHSRVIGFILTKLLSKFYVKDGSLHIGSFSVSILSGKIMFRDIHYTTKDYSIQIVDGMAIFKWWLLYKTDDQTDYRKLAKEKDITDLENYRLSLQLNAFEFHLYNRSDLYNKIQGILKCERYGDARKSVQSLDDLGNNNEKERANQDDQNFQYWRDLFPVIKVNIRSGKIAIGNRLLETTLWVHFNTGCAAYSMPDAQSSLDYFTHFVQCQCDDVRILLSRSPGYKGQIIEPPRFMGQGFVVLQTGQAKICYYQDEPGLVPVVDGNTSPESDPEWALNITFTKNATITYGPWIDKQRDLIQKFFFPNNFQELSVTKPLEAENQRLHTGFDVNIEFAKDTTMALLFSKNEETSAIHCSCGGPSSVHFYQPWTVNEYGYTSTIVANLQNVDISTSMQFRKLLQCDMLEVAINMTVPRMWNHFQHWTLEVWLSKTTLHFIYDHQDFINDMLNDWSVTEPADIAKFVPYEWEFNFYLRDFELILLVNEFNWIDCTNENENGAIALCGESLDINFVLPFTQFLPDVQVIKFFFRGETVMMRSFVPESNTLRRSIISLAQNSNRMMYPKANQTSQRQMSDQDNVDGAELDEVDFGVSPEEQLSKGWRRQTKNNAWVDVWSVPVVILQLVYSYHPIPLEDDVSNIINEKCGVKYKNIDRSKLPPDILKVELEAGPSAIRLFGHFWKQFFVGMKDNYFGLNQKMTEFNSMKESSTSHTFNGVNKNNEDGLTDIRKYRPLEANVTIVLLDVHAELTMHATEAPSPQAYTDRITFEMCKTFQETRLQLIVSPISITVQDSLKRLPDHSHLAKGFLTLSGLQFRGHAMFSDECIPFDRDTIEYAWLIEVQCGILMGKLTPLQIHSLFIMAKTFLLHFLDEENKFQNPVAAIQCQHNIPQSLCNNNANTVCPTEEAVKYKMFRFSIENVNLFLAEVECALQLQLSPLRFSTCNSKNESILQGSSFFINELAIRQFIQQVNFSLSNDANPHYVASHSNSWVEVGVVGIGPITTDFCDLDDDKKHFHQQQSFLKLHDRCTKRLWFLWNPQKLQEKLATDRKKSNICGCVGGCNFFGNNINGVRFFTNQILDASSGKSNHYGSESLWAAGHSYISGSVKEHLLRRSGTVSSNVLHGSGKVSRPPQKLNGKIGSSIASDSVDHLGSQSTYHTKRSYAEVDSKLGFGRSHSLMNGSVSHHSLSRAESEGTFYSCNSETSLFQRRSFKEKNTTPSQLSRKSVGSTGSYVSAMSSTGDLLAFDETDGSAEQQMKPLTNPGLLMAYSNYMQVTTCMNWRQHIASGLRKKFSLLKNLKVICPPGHHCSLPVIPNFNPNLHGKLPFVICRQSGEEISSTNNETDHSEKLSKNESTRSHISIKFHQQISVILTPLIIKALDRYISTFEKISSVYDLCHVIDSLHYDSVSVSKEKYVHNEIANIIKESPTTEIKKNIQNVITSTNSDFLLQIPELKLMMFQIPSERYASSEQSSLSGQCGSEYSIDLDIKSIDSFLFAANVSHFNITLMQNNDHKLVLNATADLLQKSNFEKRPRTLDHLQPNLSIIAGSVSAVHLQILHLEGNNENEVQITSIPKNKSKVGFAVKQGGSLYKDNISDMLKKEERESVLGSIIFEAGIEKIKINGLQKIVFDTKTLKPAPKPLDSQTIIDIEVPRHEDLEVNQQLSTSSSLCNKINSSSSLSNTISSFSCAATNSNPQIVVNISDENDNAESEHAALLSSNQDENTTTGYSVRYTKAETTKRRSIAVKEKAIISQTSLGNIKFGKIWVNLAAPTHLKSMNHRQEINLVTVIVSSLNCWIMPAIDIKTTIQMVAAMFLKWKYSVVACLMGQTLPEQGRLFKQHTTPSVVSKLYQFLQDEYSSQLIFVLRRHTCGHRLINLKLALKQKRFQPSASVLEKGILALARQWKCIFIGAEGTETNFTNYGAHKRPVVGRGVLTRKDLEFLIKDSGLKDSSHGSQRLISPVSNLSKSQIVSPHRLEYTDHPHGSANSLMAGSNSSSEFEEDLDKVVSKKRDGLNKEQSLYDWMSKSPVSSAMLSPTKGKLFTDGTSGRKNTLELDVFGPMISVPTSGMQIAQANEIFSSILTVLGLKEPSHYLDKKISRIGTIRVEEIDVHLHSEADGKSNEDDHKSSTFMLKTFSLVLQSVRKDRCCSPENRQPSNMQFLIEVNEIHQHINFAFVRLLLQISETLHVVKEEKKYAEKTIDVHKEKLDATENDQDIDIDETDEKVAPMPKGWRNMLNVMNLYTEASQNDRMTESPEPSSAIHNEANVEFMKLGNTFVSIREDFVSHKKHTNNSNKNASSKNLLVNENLGNLSVNGTAFLRKARFTASISGLELDWEIRKLNATYLKEIKSVDRNKDWKDTSSTSVHMEKMKIHLVECVKPLSDESSTYIPTPPELKITRNLLTCKIFRSHALHSTQKQLSRKTIERSLISIGPIAVDIPQNPGVLRVITTRFTKRLHKHFSEFNDYRNSRREIHANFENVSSNDTSSIRDSLTSTNVSATFRLISNSLLISAALLPSLRVEYKVDKVNGWGCLSRKAKFFFYLPSHILSFNTKVHVVPLPAASHIDLPPIKVEGHYLEIQHNRYENGLDSVDGSHNFLRIVIDIGSLEQNLTTDLLNHLIFLQKGFAKEVNDVIQDVEQHEPIPLWKSVSMETLQPATPTIYSVQMKIQSIQVTATTPSLTGVRFETGEVSLEISNQNPTASVLSSPSYKSLQMYGKAYVDINVSLGQFSKGLYVSAEPEFNVLANFITSLCISNTLKDDIISLAEDGKEAILITLNEPHCYIMPAALDKGVLLYLHYKNAYDYWVEQRAVLTSEFPVVAEQILNKFPQQQAGNLSSYLFLQLTINNLGVCLPLMEKANSNTATIFPTPNLSENENGASLLVTVSQTNITCCSSGSFVSTGSFRMFCLRFVDNFDHLARSWAINEDFTNTYSIPEGTYKLCSKTVTVQSPNDDFQPDKWLMTVFWKMCGVDIQVDSNIGKRLSLLTKTLTTITGDADIADLSSVGDVKEFENFDLMQKADPFEEQEDDFDYVDSKPSRQSPISLEQQLWIQTKRVNQFRRNNAHPEVISREVRQLQEIETALSNEFFKDVKKRFSRKSRKSTVSRRRGKSFNQHPKTPPYLLPGKKRAYSNVVKAHLENNQVEGFDHSGGFGQDQVDATPLEDVSEYGKQATDGQAISSSSFHDFIATSSSDNKPKDTRVKFSESTLDVHSELPEVNKPRQNMDAILLDFDLNIVVDIDSGKCTFRSADTVKESNDVIDGDAFVKETASRRFSEQVDGMSYRKLPHIHRQIRGGRSSSNSSVGQNTVEDAFILIPGVNVRVHYVSTNTIEKSRLPSCDSDYEVSSSHSSSNSRQQVKKAGSVDALISIQSLPKEMVVRPSLLEFLDKALQPIIEANDLDTTIDSESLNGTGSMLSSGANELSSFPVNVVVLIRVEPSDVRFSCLPISKVEFLLRIPSLDFAITSTPPASTSLPVTPQKRKTNKKSISVMDSEYTEKFSFTLCLSRFSFCIFHPYGKHYDGNDARQKTGMSSAKRKNFKTWAQPLSGHKDSLSLNVDYIKFNLYRETIRVIKDKAVGDYRDFKTLVKISGICDIGATAINYDMRRMTEILDVPKAWYKRHLFQRMFLGKEATYATQTSQLSQTSRSIISPSSPDKKNLVSSPTLIGTRPQPPVDLKSSPKTQQKQLKKMPVASHRRALSSGASFLGSLMGTPYTTSKSANFTTSKNDLVFKYDYDKIKQTDNSVKLATIYQYDSVDGTSSEADSNEHETKIAMAFNITQVDVLTNMGNVMGQVFWSTNNLHAMSGVLLNNTGNNTGHIEISVRLGSLDAHGGVIGCNLELRGIHAYGDFKENIGQDPEHLGTVALGNGEVRLDYMGSSVVMATLSSCKSVLKDKWFIPNQIQQTVLMDGTGVSNEARCTVHVLCDVRWDAFEMIISRSSTPDILKMVARLEEFFDQQRRSGAHALSTLNEGYSRPMLYPQAQNEFERSNPTHNGLKHQHWIELLNGLRGMNLSNLSTKISDNYSLVSGKLSLKGDRFSLACFHGSNFRSQNWGLFTVYEPNMTFTSVTDVQERSCNVMRASCKQELLVCLGTSQKVTSSEKKRSSGCKDFMAIVRRVSRGRRNPPSLGATVEEWLMFVNTVSDGDVAMGKQTKQSEVGEIFSHTKTSSGVRKVSFAPKYRYQNESEVIFALPVFTVQLNTAHNQPMTSRIAKCLTKSNRYLDLNLPPTVSSHHLVDTSFTSHFEDNIHVTMDVSLLFYLHNLILSYMKEKEISMAASNLRSSRRSTTDEEDSYRDTSKHHPEPGIKKEDKFREFRCKNWKLEPRISLLSWAGKRMEPVSIDWVLEKLGFMDAALTVPKWIQRGAMDSMDIALAQLMAHLLTRMKKKDTEETGEE